MMMSADTNNDDSEINKEGDAPAKGIKTEHTSDQDSSSGFILVYSIV